KVRFRQRRLLVISTSIFAMALGAVIAFAAHSVSPALDNETPVVVIRVANAARPELESRLAAVRDAQAIVTRLQNRAFAAQVLDVSRKNDKKALSDLLKSAAPSRQINVTAIDDFTITFSFGTDSHDYTLCIGDKCKHPSGAKSPIVFTEF